MSVVPRTMNAAPDEMLIFPAATGCWARTGVAAAKTKAVAQVPRIRMNLRQLITEHAVTDLSGFTGPPIGGWEVPSIRSTSAIASKPVPFLIIAQLQPVEFRSCGRGPCTSILIDVPEEAA